MEKGDHWIKMIGFVALALHWFNPLVWVAYVLLCKDIEIACDQRVVQFMELDERKAYSSALLLCSTNRVHYAACPVAFGEVSVKYRIQSVLNYRKRYPRDSGNILNDFRAAEWLPSDRRETPVLCQAKLGF